MRQSRESVKWNVEGSGLLVKTREADREASGERARRRQALMQVGEVKSHTSENHESAAAVA